jgi:hypothetical protein
VPIETNAQATFLNAKHPALSQEWSKKYGTDVLRKRAIKRLKINAKLSQLTNGQSPISP